MEPATVNIKAAKATKKVSAVTNSAVTNSAVANSEAPMPTPRTLFFYAGYTYGLFKSAYGKIKSVNKQSNTVALPNSFNSVSTFFTTSRTSFMAIYS